jgi:hypothetical protein
MWHGWGRRGMNRGFRGESPKESDRQEDFDVGGRIILKLISENENGVVWIGLIWLRMEIIGGLFSTI